MDDCSPSPEKLPRADLCPALDPGGLIWVALGLMN
jgi:hypothetical protein